MQRLRYAFPCLRIRVRFQKNTQVASRKQITVSNTVAETITDGETYYFRQVGTSGELRAGIVLDNVMA